jgi:hypothetical protein
MLTSDYYINRRAWSKIYYNKLIRNCFADACYGNKKIDYRLHKLSPTEYILNHYSIF